VETGSPPGIFQGKDSKGTEFTMLLERLSVFLFFLSISNFSTFLSIFYNIYSCRFHTLLACFGMNASPSSFLSLAQVQQSSSFPGKHPERSFSENTL